jgi:predicted deacylase
MKITYFQFGTPETLFLSGMHGNENQSGEIFQSLIQKYTDYVYIPNVSPSAVKQKTRHNMFDHDINRQFFDGTSDTEALEIMKIVKPFHVTKCIDIHEDPDRTSSFYMYVSHHLNDTDLSTYRSVMTKANIHLYTGIDDIEDELLGCHIVNGYYPFRDGWLSETPDEGFFSKWAINHGIADRVFTVEIPGKADAQIKQTILKNLIPFLLSV